MQELTVRPDGSGQPQPAAPLDPFPAASEALGSLRLRRILWALVALGIVVRLIRFLLRFPLWPDEAFLAHSYLDRGYLALLEPLDFRQVGPLLYLWIQLTFIKLLGFSEFSLRLYVLLCGIGSLFLFRHLASRLLGGTALLLAVGAFAVAYPLIRYSAEAKPYGSDMFASLALLTLFVEWCRAPQDRRWAWALAAALPVAVALSFPAVFVGGGIVLAMGLVLLGRGTWRAWLRWATCGLTLCGGFAALFAFSAANQMSSAGTAMRACWSDTFPPLRSPGRLAAFLLESHTSEALSYPVGGAHGASTLTFLCSAAAVWVLLRGRRFALLTACLCPLALNFIAAAMHCYPYAGHVRFALYLAPIVCLLTGLGGAALLSLLRGRRWPAAAPVVVTAAVLAVIGVAASTRDFFKPYKETCFMRNRDFARWFWFDKAIGAELVCAETDLHQKFHAPRDCDDIASLYYCNQRIYSPRHARREDAHLDQVSRSRPLRCACFMPAADHAAHDDAARLQWLGEMQARYRLVGKEEYPLPFFRKERELLYVDRIELYEFVPRDALADRAGDRPLFPGRPE
ncbi:MAG: glycosyltransferase family 39 protein [Thermoguttaceae bacterium]|jgi:4-amino-4-deoxy-L-arabinose transferase-like glycosyltransferase